MVDIVAESGWEWDGPLLTLLHLQAYRLYCLHQAGLTGLPEPMAKAEWSGYESLAKLLRPELEAREVNVWQAVNRLPDIQVKSISNLFS